MLRFPLFEPPRDAAQAARLEVELLRELARRARMAMVFLVPALFVLWGVLAEALAASPWARFAFWLTVALGAGRWAILTYALRAEPSPAVVRRGRRLAFGTSLAMGLGFAALHLSLLPHLDAVHLALVTIIATGITSVALVSLAAVSLGAYFAFMIPNLLSLIVAGARAESPELAFYLPLLIVIYMLALAAMALWVHDHLRRNLVLAVQLSELALRDELTGLYNRRFLEEFMTHEAQRVLRTWFVGARAPVARESLAFLIVDLDRFKSINDEYGHDAGDAALRQLALLLTSTVRGPDLVVRWGGEEFLIVAYGIDRRGVAELAERVRRRVQDTPFELPRGGAPGVTCSIGYALFPFDTAQHMALSWREVLTIADRALYLGKRHGRNRCFGIHSDPAHPAPTGTDLLRLMAEDAAALDGLVRFETRPPLRIASAENSVRIAAR